MEKNIVLPDTSLCAIVRDEKMNPAGGIERFIDSHVPFVEQAVIADIGSVDGTREILEQMQSKYSNLKVVDVPFEGYADARNKAMKFVQTKRVLVLDADELLTHEKPQNDWEILKRFIEENPSRAYKFDFLSINPHGQLYVPSEIHSIRLFDLLEALKFRGYIGVGNLVLSPIYVKDLKIKHFVPEGSALQKKRLNLYGLKKQPSTEKFEEPLFKKQPSMIKGFAGWKAYNSQRDNYE